MERRGEITPIRNIPDELLQSRRRSRTLEDATLNEWTLAALGSAGGSLRGLIYLYGRTMAWAAARREQREISAGKPFLTLGHYVDYPAYAITTILQMILGGVAAAIFGTTGQITGAYAAVAVGASAPTLIAQLGQIERLDRSQDPPPLRPRHTSIPQSDQEQAREARTGGSG